MTSIEHLKEFGVEWVGPSANGRRRGYYRRIPKTRQSPTLSQAQHRLRLSEVSYQTYGIRGIKATEDGRLIPLNASVIGDQLRGSGQPKRELTMTEKLIQLILTS